MNIFFTANSASSLDGFLEELEKSIDQEKTDVPGVINQAAEKTASVAPDNSILDISLSDLINSFMNELPLILISALVLTVLSLMLWYYFDSKRSKLRYLTTLTPKHFTPEVFNILGKQCHLLAYRTGYGFALMAIRLVDKKVTRKQHFEFACCVAACLREDDIIGDYDDGHFKVLLPYLAEVNDYGIVLHRLRTKLIRTSIGINNVEYSSTVFPDGGSTFQQMLRASNRSFKPL